jgi:hypothetical protein
VVVVAIGLLAAVARYWSPAFINDGHWYTYPDNTTRFVGTVPVIHNTPGFVTLLFAAGCILAALVFFRREITRREVASLILCMPLVVSIAGTLGEYWYPLGPQLFEYWPWFVLTSAGVGLAGIAWSVLQRTMPKSASPAPGEHA